MKPLVSVLLPVRDAAPWLGECLRSLGEQTLADHEIVAIDDGSRDGSGTLLDAAARRDRRLRVVHTAASGLVAALNRAASLARSEILVRMDADDLARPARLECLWRRLATGPHADIVASGVELLGDPGGPNAGLHAYVDWTNNLIEHADMARERFVDAPVIHPSVALRREVLECLGGYRAFDGPEDYDLWLRAFERGLRFAKLREPLLAWRDSAGRLTRADARYSSECFFVLKLEALLRGPLARQQPIVVWGAGPIGKRWSRLLQAAGRPVTAFVEVDPRKLGQRIHGVPVVRLEEAPNWPGAVHLAAVGRPGARERIRAAAEGLGLVMGEQLWPVA